MISGIANIIFSTKKVHDTWQQDYAINTRVARNVASLTMQSVFGVTYYLELVTFSTEPEDALIRTIPAPRASHVLRRSLL
jgi:hypothetical protein